MATYSAGGLAAKRGFTGLQALGMMLLENQRRHGRHHLVSTAVMNTFSITLDGNLSGFPSACQAAQGPVRALARLRDPRAE